ncbi:hypothetical protein Ancab_018147 [Ancistrocladus abbreviatus]
MDSEEERIGLVLVRASQLRSKIANCIHKSAAQTHHDSSPFLRTTSSSSTGGHPSFVGQPNDAEQEEEEDEDADEESLFNICDAFESLESQLSSLQALLQQQQFEREAAIGEIEYNRAILLKKLQEYKGKHLDVIQEASAFLSMKVEHKNELLLPPYPSHAPHSLMLDSGQLSHFSHAHKSNQNGHAGGSGILNEAKDLNVSERSQAQTTSSNVWKGLRFLVSSAAKTMLTLIGVVSVLSVAGFEPGLAKRDPKFKALGLFQQPDTEERRLSPHCPPGKVAVVEDGEIRCLVKERVQIPFDPVAVKADINYGCG